MKKVCPKFLCGPELDWAVAHVLGMNPPTKIIDRHCVFQHAGRLYVIGDGYSRIYTESDLFSPSSKWEQGAKIACERGISTILINDRWYGTSWITANATDEYGDLCHIILQDCLYEGKTPLIAVMRAFVGDVLDHVQIPEGLM